MAQFLSAADAMEALHLPPSTFYRYVRDGKIKKHFPTPVSKHGIYDAVEIARLKKQLRLEERPPLVGDTDWVKLSDLGNIYNLEFGVYGDETGDPSIIKDWYVRNPTMCRLLFNKKDRTDLWGALNMVPLAEEVIYKLLKDEIRDVDLVPEQDILTYAEPGVFNLYVASIIIRPERTLHLKLLIDSVFDFWCGLAPDRQIGKIYGRVVTDNGEMLAKKLYFSPIWYVSDTAWMLDVSRPNPSKIVQSFQECIKEKVKEAGE